MLNFPLYWVQLLFRGSSSGDSIRMTSANANCLQTGGEKLKVKHGPAQELVKDCAPVQTDRVHLLVQRNKNVRELGREVHEKLVKCLRLTDEIIEVGGPAPYYRAARRVRVALLISLVSDNSSNARAPDVGPARSAR